jgi:hypothetical protein
MSDPNTNDFPAEPARPVNIGSEIDRLVGNTLPANVRFNYDGSTEQLPTPRNEMSNSGDMAPPPSIDDLTGQIGTHQSRITAIREQLAAQVYSRTTGQAEGPHVTGAAREQLEREMAHRWREVEYTMQLIESTSAARVAWQQQRVAQAAGSDATPSHDALNEAARRERAISELSEQMVNGRPLGRVEAAKLFDTAAAQAKAERLARGK